MKCQVHITEYEKQSFFFFFLLQQLWAQTLLTVSSAGEMLSSPA